MDSLFRTANYLSFSFYRRKEVPEIPQRELVYLDLTYCLEGTMEYLFEGKRVTLHAGDAILYPPGSVRERFYTAEPNYYASFNIQFEEPFCPPVHGYLPQCVCPDTVPLLELFRKDFESVSPHKQEKCAALFSYFYYQLMETALDKENRSVKNAKQYMRNRLGETVLLEEIAEAVHLAPTYLCSLFKKSTGMTVMEYLVEQRIDLAKRLIITRDLPLSRIAELSGFGDYNYFSQTFKRLTGMTAIQYRKMQRDFQRFGRAE